MSPVWSLHPGGGGGDGAECACPLASLSPLLQAGCSLQARCPAPPGKYVVLFFYPLDFTFVCPTEIIAFSEHAEDFRKLGCEVLGVSVDSQFTHLAW